jgi:hypothetical protein
MSEIPKKKTFGGAYAAMIRPEPGETTPRAFNVHLTFDEALKLHFAIGQALARIGGYNRSTSAGKRAAVNLCLYPHKKRITINEGKLRKASSKSAVDGAPESEPDQQG